MAPDMMRELYRELSRGSPARLAFTRRAFEMLPKPDGPTILDVGCGQGGPTLELARLSNGHVTGLDIDQWALDELAFRAASEGLSTRVQALHGSMSNMAFEDASYDILWCEGALYALGFEQALRDWKRLIRPGGFLVVHDMVWLRKDPPAEILNCPQLAYPGMKTVSEAIDLIVEHGYTLIGHFVLPTEFWWDDFFAPLVARIGELRTKYPAGGAVQTILDQEEQAAELYRAYSDWYSSAFFVMQRGAG